MRPDSLIVYAVCLYLTLLSLLKWTVRRHRLARTFRRGVAEALGPEDPAEKLRLFKRLDADGQDRNSAASGPAKAASG